MNRLNGLARYTTGKSIEFLTVHIKLIFEKTEEIARMVQCLVGYNIWAYQLSMVVEVFTNRQVGYHRNLCRENNVIS